MSDRLSHRLAHDIPERRIQAAAPGLAGALLVLRRAAEIVKDRLDFERRAADHQFGIPQYAFSAPGSVAPAGQAGVGTDLDQGGFAPIGPVQ